MKKQNRSSFIATLFFLCIFMHIGNSQTITGNIDVPLQNGKSVNIQVCSEKIIRIRVGDKKNMGETLTERYGIVKTDWPKTNIKSSTEGDYLVIQTSKCKVLVNKKNGIISVTDTKNKPIIGTIKAYPEGKDSICNDLLLSLQQYFGNDKFGGGIIGDTSFTGKKNAREEITTNSQSGVIEISLNDNERFYGGGSASRNTIQHRGTALRMWSQYQRSESPTPFVVSSNGWGIFNNTTTRNYFDMGRFQKDKMFIYNTNEGLDFYLMLGDNMPDVLDLYTTITGKPYLLPKWAYGLAFGSNILENQFNVLDNATRFRNEKIPCDIYWLETQWMSKAYDFSTKKNWNEEKFQAAYSWCKDPKDAKASNLFIQRMKDLGFKTALWLCIDHDLSIEEEDRLSIKAGKTPSTSEHWFDHLNTFVDQGVAGFKLDPGRTQDEHPDRKYFNGKTDAVMHNLNQVLLQKQMNLTFREHTGLRSFHHYCGGYAGTQHWGAATVGDNGGNVKTLFDIFNHSFSGNSNMSIDVLENIVNKPPAIHYSFLIPWVNLNSWAWMLHPWYYNDHDKNMFRFYAQLRYSLIPYIYSMAINSSITGMPIVRPMSLIYPEDEKSDNLMNQYMFGDQFLVGAFTDSVWLPNGNWIDFWTGMKYKGNQLLKCNIPENRGGPLFVKSGAIIPCQKPVQYISEQPIDTLIVKVYPEKQSSYTLLEDDGKTFDYEKGKIARTRFECKDTEKRATFTIYPLEGGFTGMFTSRMYQLEVVIPHKPAKVLLNNQTLKKWEYNNSGKLIILINQKQIIEKQVVEIIKTL